MADVVSALTPPAPSEAASPLDTTVGGSAAQSSSLLHTLLRAVQAVPTLIWVVIGMFAWFCYQLYLHQESLLYHPTINVPGMPPIKRIDDNPKMFQSPSEHGLQFENVVLTAADGVKLHAWFVFAPETVDHSTAPTIVFFHANAGNMGLRLPNVKLLVEKVEANVLIFDYHGYGNSEGTPTEHGLQLDGDAVMDHLAQRWDIDHSKIIFFGRSLGGAVAIRTAVNRPTEVAVVVLENTFTSISDMVDVVMPLLSKIKFLVLKIGWSSIAIIHKLNQPLLFISGSDDKLVPPAMMRRLSTAATGSKKKAFVTVEGGDHNDTFQKGGEKYAVALRDFVYASLKLVLGRDATPTRKTAGAAAIHGSTAAQGTSGAAPLAHADGAFATISSMGAVR